MATEICESPFFLPGEVRNALPKINSTFKGEKCDIK